MKGAATLPVVVTVIRRVIWEPGATVPVSEYAEIREFTNPAC
jgi:hypothetical protein